ncbi:FixH family protein [Aestuariivirga sp.]|uniref:FixH family protein n=1 Tax=Aestuariivirga sp. TaxID=2650926 RepID=UPI0039E2A4DC
MSDSLQATPLTGRKVAAIFVAFFGVVIAVNTVLAVMAERSWTGLVVENSYVASQTFDKDTAELQKSLDMKIAHMLHFDGSALDLKLTQPDGTPFAVENVKLSLGRPADNEDDQVISLTRIDPGQYQGKASLKRGVWEGEISASMADGDTWRKPVRLIVGGP